VREVVPHGADRTTIRDLVGGLPEDVTMLLIEHDMELALGLADRVTCLHQRRGRLPGHAGRIKADERVKDIYLGRGE
jgi:branched-chain amino acid transport system ATP-binding protein